MPSPLTLAEVEAKLHEGHCRRRNECDGESPYEATLAQLRDLLRAVIAWDESTAPPDCAGRPHSCPACAWDCALRAAAREARGESR